MAAANCVRLFWSGSNCALYGSFDTGWIIQTGEFILHHGPPHYDMFSWSCPDRIFVAYQWLFELLAALTFTLGGLWLIGLLSCLLTGILYFYFLPRIWLSRGVPPAITFAFLSLVLTPHWFNARPQLISYWFLLTFIVLLEHYRTTRRASVLCILPILMLLWANIHLFCSIGLILIAIYCICSLLDKRHSKKPLTLTLIASTLMILINPYGLQLVSYFFTFFNHSQYLGMYEVMPSIFFVDAMYVIAYLAIMVSIIAWKRKYVPLEGFCVVALATIAALSVRRYESLAVLLTWPYLGMALARVSWSQLSGTGGFGLAMKQPIYCCGAAEPCTSHPEIIQ